MPVIPALGTWRPALVCSKFEISLDYMITCLKKRGRKKGTFCHTMSILLMPFILRKLSHSWSVPQQVRSGVDCIAIDRPSIHSD